MQYKHKKAFRRDLEEKIIREGVILEIIGKEEVNVLGKKEERELKAIGYFRSFDGTSIYLDQSQGYYSTNGCIVPFEKITKYRIVY